MVTQLKSASEYDNALASGDKLVVVDFFATWCGPCKMIAPMIEKFSEQYSDATFYKLDVDEVSDVAQKAEVSSMPTLIFYKSGKEVTRVVGANPAAIKQAIASNV
ncbi:thioredoxin TRX2 [Saccharomyces paradoxus]|uniref:Thioredoxin n=1 Tax=Saccharomyces paradoxus TaxID=27291 RepID=A0A8B8US27_SACPA|nr:Trx2 [Saccharomyces paradoxus]QHS73512.1 Trx2 [Saccharomyces paradoxus]